jgi:N-acetyl-anhydromuramyl-L-alanine amidase AmpD
MQRLLLFFGAILCALVSTAQSHLSAEFQSTYSHYSNITPGVLEAVSWNNTRMKQLENTTPSCSGLPMAYGIMGLFDDGKGYFNENGKYIATLSGISIDDQKSSISDEINAYGFVYNHLMTAEIAGGGNKLDGKSIRNVLLQLSEIPDSGIVNLLARDMQVYEVLRFLNDHSRSVHFGFTDYEISLESVFGQANFQVLSSKKIQFTDTGIQSDEGIAYSASTFSLKSIQYGPAIWNPAPTCNFSSRSGVAISAITIHTIQGSYAGAISWAQNCNSNVSYHYVIRSSDGQVTQMVLEENKAWHVGSENPYTIGYEHEGYVNDPVWYTPAMYAASADLSRDIVNSGYGIPPLRTFFGDATVGTNTLGACTKIKGHQHYPNQSHTDPGINWDWENYYRLINNTPSYTTISTTSGSFYDTGGATGNYQDDEREIWLFQPASAQSVTLDFTAFNIEIDYDYLYIYDGSTIDAPLIGTYTGTNSPGVVTSTGGAIVVEFRSDCGTTSSGWEVAFTSTNTVDQNPPTTSIAAGTVWQIDDFTVDITDADNESTIDQGYYLAAEKNITDNGWKSNGTYGFVHGDFEDVNTTWTNQVGLHTITNGEFIYADVNEQNSNAYASVAQDATTKFLFEWNQSMTSTGTNQRAGMHFFCDAPTLPNRGNSYFIYFRESTDNLQIYRVTNDVFSVESNSPLTIVPNVDYNCKVSYDPTSGQIKVYVDNVLISEWIDPQPLTSGNSISVRTGGCSAAFDDIHVYRSRGNQVTIPAGFGELMSIESENAIETGLVNSIVLDAADNWSSIESETYLLDFTAPVLDFLNDGLAADIDTVTSTSITANWLIEDIHSDISNFDYAIGSAPNLDDVKPWTSNGTASSIGSVVPSLINNQLYYVSVRAENNAGWESEFVSDGQRYVNDLSTDELNALFESIVIYPNPASDVLKISGVPADASLYLIDAKGSIVKEYNSETTSTQLDVTQFARGSYQLMIKVGEVFAVKKIVLM